jgi:addiction module HigA family antidote
MTKTKKTPATVLTGLLEKHDLNFNRLAKAIGLSSAMVRLIARDENPVSASVAFRLARFFKTKPEFWLSLQLDFDISKAAQDKKLAKELKDIPTVDKATFERKPKAAKSAKKGKPASGKKPAAKKTVTKKAVSKKKPASAKKAGKPAKSARPQKKAKPAKAAAVKKPASRAVKTPAAKKSPVKPSAPVQKAPPVVKVEPKPVVTETPPANQPHPESMINEPNF